MNKVPALETVAENFNQPNARDNAAAFNFENIGFEISMNLDVKMNLMFPDIINQCFVSKLQKMKLD